MLKERGKSGNKSSTTAQVPHACILISQAHCECGLTHVCFVDQSHVGFLCSLFPPWNKQTKKYFHVHLLSFLVDAITVPPYPTLYTEPDQGNHCQTSSSEDEGLVQVPARSSGHLKPALQFPNLKYPEDQTLPCGLIWHLDGQLSVSLLTGKKIKVTSFQSL